MDEIHFLVQGSADEPYKVLFRKSGNNLIALCTCPAGTVGQYCKHRLGILKGLTNNIVSENEEYVKVVESWLHGSNIEKVLNQLKEAENSLESAKKNVSLLKKKLARSMLGDEA
jgi:uncharacterized Zn finger protein